jgi:hypothetical protein
VSLLLFIICPSFKLHYLLIVKSGAELERTTSDTAWYDRAQGTAKWEEK